MMRKNSLQPPDPAASRQSSRQESSTSQGWQLSWASPSWVYADRCGHSAASRTAFRSYSLQARAIELKARPR